MLVLRCIYKKSENIAFVLIEIFAGSPEIVFPIFFTNTPDIL